MIEQHIQRFNSMPEATADTLAVEQRALLRIGAIYAIAGPLILFASFAPHGDLPTHVSIEAALGYIADHPLWLPIHLGTIVAAPSRSVSSRPSPAPSRRVWRARSAAC